MALRIRNILFFNPPGPLYQRGEDRSQGNVDSSSATSLRAPNDLAYMAAMVRRIGIEPHVRDYPAEHMTWVHYEAELRRLQPDAVVMSITNATIFQDVKAFDIAKRVNDRVVTVAKGALFYACDVKALDRDVFRSMDFALFGEAETIINDLVRELRQGGDAHAVPGVIARKEGRFVRNAPKAFDVDLDQLPFPARDLLRNDLYVRPDTGEPQATIQTARGCPLRCIFCLTPAISGQKVRQRSATNVVDEIEQCVRDFGIRNFFFKADTFTINKRYVVDICREILRRNLDVQWVANSRVDTIDAERLEWMKRAGCWLVAFGLESGDDDMLRMMKKDATCDDARRAVRLVQAHGLSVFGFFMIGLPWDTEATVQRTLDFAAELDCDFVELHIATPYEGTELYDLAKDLGLIDRSVMGHDYFEHPAAGTLTMTREQLLTYRQKGLKRLYLSPSYVVRTLGRIRSSRQLINYATYGARLVRNMLKTAG